ncbi:molybdopterin-guanine dinucleotide biosynthesis protein [Georgenia sp. 311]|uniref:molybdenum cofactor guanylyltransferase n=1 Tax=Georgenia sp. 311 TaxID=2585134 RepID=UPI001111BC35|nr:NTP transferase domain-containing protein [Georgenia sp. 311]TNC16891.1 molybdopterin-guanine dinucleotide biosynthesis protein [Georgenia sp. 311]
MELSHDAIVLAGGTGRRLGGVLKPQVTVRGRRLLDHVLDATTGARRVVVVAPEAVPVPDGVLRTLEDPPHGGPVAGIAAGLAALADPAPVVLLLACDLPGAAAAVPRLLATAGDLALPGGRNSAVVRNSAVAGEVVGGVDGVVVRDVSGREQWLLGLYSTAALAGRVGELAAAGRVRGGSVRDLLGPLHLGTVLASAEESRDVDTWADRDALEG